MLYLKILEVDLLAFTSGYCCAKKEHHRASGMTVDAGLYTATISSISQVYKYTKGGSGWVNYTVQLFLCMLVEAFIALRLFPEESSSKT